jgi:uncharacterized protein (TIGR03437 family)
MSPRHKLRIVKLSVILAAVPVIVHGYSEGPPWGYTGAPGDQTCVECHSAFPLNSQGGNVKILFPSGNTGTYVPGQTMQLLVQITDSKEQAFGFELTARLANNTQAGDFSPADVNTQVLCADGNLESFYGSACPARYSIEDIEHDLTGFNASVNSSGSFTYTVNWTPPATGSGNVTLYVAANCGPKLAQEDPTHVYTSTLILTPTAASPSPTITNVQNAATFQTALAPNTYAAVFGSNLSTTNPGRAWAASDFTTNSNDTLNMPTSLDGTSVTIGGAPAYINYISPGQINIITPPTVTPGSNIPVVVTVNGQASATFTVTIQNLAPSFFAWQPSTSDFGKYLIAQHSNFTNVGKVGLFPGTPTNFTTPAAPGETIILYGTGFGPTSPPIVNGIETDKVYSLSPMPTATFGTAPATVVFGGLIPPLSQVYQFNVTIPPNAPNGDSPLVVTVNGTQSFSGLITVQGP